MSKVRTAAEIKALKNAKAAMNKDASKDDTVLLSLRVTKELKDQMTKAAKLQDLTLTQAVRRAYNDYDASYGTSGGGDDRTPSETATPADSEQIVVRISPALRKTMKSNALDNDMSLLQASIFAFEDYVSKHT